MAHIIDRLLKSSEPCVRYKVLTGVLGEDADSGRAKALRGEIRESPRVQALLAEQQDDGTIPYHPYTKWYGAHWVLAALADIGVPQGDMSLIPLREQAYEWLFSEEHEHEDTELVNGRVRRCASQEGNAVN